MTTGYWEKLISSEIYPSNTVTLKIHAQSFIPKGELSRTMVGILADVRLLKSGIKATLEQLFLLLKELKERRCESRIIFSFKTKTIEKF